MAGIIDILTGEILAVNLTLTEAHRIVNIIRKTCGEAEAASYWVVEDVD